MRIGCSNVLVKLQVATRKRQSLLARIRQQLEKLVQHTRAERASRLELALQVEGVEKARRSFAIPFGEQEPRNRDQLILFPIDLSRRSRLFQFHEDVRRIASRIIGVVKQADRDPEIGWVATESLT